MELKDLKKNYELQAKKYKLPEFSELNNEFDIEKIEKETDTLLRAVRKIMMEKIINSMSFLEMLLNPMNVPRMYMSFVRSMTQEDKEDISKTYDSFSKLSLIALDNEIDYSEKAESELIKKMFISWKESKPAFRRILAKMKKPVSNDVKKEKSYFG